MSRDGFWRSFTALFWTIAGSLHFLKPAFYEAIVPPPFRRLKRAVVLLSGAAEMLGGLAVLPNRTRAFARAWLLGTLAAVYPANIYMALAPERFSRFPRWALRGRLPLQFLIAWFTWRGTQ
jgi:uncharacterized membrane protein